MTECFLVLIQRVFSVSVNDVADNRLHNYVLLLQTKINIINTIHANVSLGGGDSKKVLRFTSVRKSYDKRFFIINLKNIGQYTTLYQNKSGTETEINKIAFVCEVYRFSFMFFFLLRKCFNCKN